MSSDQSFVDYVLENIDLPGRVTTRKMFGEYALYCDGVVVALICDNQLFVKVSEAGRAFIGKPVLAPAYPGAKPSFMVNDYLDDRAWLTELILITLTSLPLKKPSRTKKTGS